VADKCSIGNSAAQAVMGYFESKYFRTSDAKRKNSVSFSRLRGASLMAPFSTFSRTASVALINALAPSASFVIQALVASFVGQRIKDSENGMANFSEGTLADRDIKPAMTYSININDKLCHNVEEVPAFGRAIFGLVSPCQRVKRGV
jgi:hypothetical protein